MSPYLGKKGSQWPLGASDAPQAPDQPVKSVGRRIYWLGTEVQPCGKCGVAAANVDDCGHFGDPKCPRFGVIGTQKS